MIPDLSELTVNIILSILLVTIAIPPTLGDILKRQTMPNGKKKVTGLTVNGWFFFPLVILAGYFSYYKEVISEAARNNDKTEFKKEIDGNRTSDSTQIVQLRDKILDSLGLGNNKIGSKIDALKDAKNTYGNNEPSITIAKMPFFTSSDSNNNYNLNIFLRNIGNGNAIKIVDSYVLMLKKMGLFLKSRTNSE